MNARSEYPTEYDAYVVPEQGEDSPENRLIVEKLMEEIRRTAQQVIESHKNDPPVTYFE